MNKEDLIKKYEGLEGVWDANGAEIARQCFLRDLEQLNEIDTKKVTVPQYVADWIKYCKKHNFTLFGCLEPESGFESLVNETFEGDARKCIRWCRRESNIFARAWLDGYTVEEEKKYLVKMKGISVDSDYLNYDSIDDEWYLASDINGCNVRTHHTRKQLEEAGFDWVFDCPGIEIEEVTE